VIEPSNDSRPSYDSLTKSGRETYDNLLSQFDAAFPCPAALDIIPRPRPLGQIHSPTKADLLRLCYAQDILRRYGVVLDLYVNRAGTAPTDARRSTAMAPGGRLFRNSTLSRDFEVPLRDLLDAVTHYKVMTLSQIVQEVYLGARARASALTPNTYTALRRRAMRRMQELVRDGYVISARGTSFGREEICYHVNDPESNRVIPPNWNRAQPPIGPIHVNVINETARWLLLHDALPLACDKDHKKAVSYLRSIITFMEEERCATPLRAPRRILNPLAGGSPPPMPFGPAPWIEARANDAREWITAKMTAGTIEAEFAEKLLELFTAVVAYFSEWKIYYENRPAPAPLRNYEN